MEFNYQICDKEKCTACLACMNKCPKGAIECRTDKYGQLYPYINKEKCVKCGLCVQVCPANHSISLQKPYRCYAAQRMDREIREQSSSGGIGALLAEYVISIGGSVFGAVVNEQGEVVHICAETKEEVARLRGSKYVQSDIGWSFQNVEEKLRLDKTVLFIGTPCQIAGLKSYLGRDYEKLYCVDLICHGVPSMQYLREHYESIAKGRKISDVTFRNPKIGFCLSLKSDGKEIYSSDRVHDTYFHAFFHALNYRENCYQCKYACESRCSELTIGDFWGINRKTLKVIQSGYISVVLVNNQRGEFLFEQIKEQLLFEERNITEAVSGNKQLQAPAMKHSLRDAFLSAYEKEQDFDKAVERIALSREMKREAMKSKIEWLSRKIVHRIRMILK